MGCSADYTYLQFQNSQELALDGVVFDTLANSDESRAGEVFVSALVFNMSLALEMKRFRCKMGLFQKVMTCKLCQKENFENGVSLFKLASCMYC